MKVAIIDMGTNTFHLLLAEVTDSHYTMLLRDRKSVKIGEKGINKGEITKEAWDRAVHTLKDFKSIIDENEVAKIFATATSAIRNAANGKELVREIEKQTGIKTDIISGEKEAELILKGVRKALKIGKKSLIMDIGGGSIEFIIADSERTYWLQSFEIGGQRLIERFHKSDPIADDELIALNEYFRKQLDPLIKACEVHKPKTLIGCSGTFDTLSDIYCEENNIDREENNTELPFPIEAFNEILKDLTSKTRGERLQIPGMIEMRVDMIVVACILVDFLIKSIGLKEIRVSAYALKEGVLYHTFDRLNTSVKAKS